MSGRLEVLAPDGLPEIGPGDDLAALLLAALAEVGGVVDGDVLVVTSKVVSKAEGRVVAGAREQHVDAESVRVVARRGPTRIARTRHGLTLAAAGVDASNVAAGSAVLLPLDPDASARRLREAVRAADGANVAVVVTDTAGRAWREGQTDLAVGAAGMRVLESFAGRSDVHGNELAVTAPAVADEVAGAAELAQGKLAGRPCALVRGRADLVLSPGEHGPGAAALVRPEGADLFGWGAREAVVRAVAGHDADRAPFGSPAEAGEVAAAVDRALGPAVRAEVRTGEAPAVACAAGAGHVAALAVLAFAHGWRAEAAPGGEVLLLPADP